MTTSDLAKWLQLATVTIRQWSAGEWSQYLSPSARGGGKSRVFSDQDARVIAHIARLKASGQDRDSIHASLKALQADEWCALPDMPTAPPDFEPIPVVPAAAANATIEQQRRGLLREISILEDRIEQLEGELSNERKSKAALQSDLLAARERVGELTGRLSAVETERRPASWWLRIVAAAVLAAFVVTALLALLLVGRG